MVAQFSGMGAVVLDAPTGRYGFRVWAPNANRVFVSGPFCGWSDSSPTCALTHEGNGYWAVIVTGIGLAPGDLTPIPYQFVFHRDGEGAVWRTDAYARDVEEEKGSQHGLVVDTRFTWAPFATPRFDELILYQLHVGSFAGFNDGVQVDRHDGQPTATCDQIVDKLDYIRGLGFNGIALLPLGETPRAPNERHMGYAPTNWFAPESDFGSPGNVRKLVDECHRRGIAVIFDVVYNHASIDENRYWEYDGFKRDGGIYFEAGGDSAFGRIPAHWKEEVRTFFLDNARMWLDEYRGDGLRFDAAHIVQRGSLQHILQGVRANPFWRDKFMVAEWDGNDRAHWSEVINDIGFDALWGMSGPYAFREAILRGAFGGKAIDPLLNVMNLAPYRNTWDVIRYYLGSHDQIRDEQSGKEGDHRYAVQYFGGREKWTARSQCRLGWALAVTAPGVPQLFMGSEGHLPGYWWPTADANPLYGDHRMDWSKVGDPIGAPMQRLVRDANRMRGENPALRSRSFDVCHRDDDNNVFAFRRWTDQGNVVLTVVNCGEREWPGGDYRLRTGTDGRWAEIFNSQAPVYDGYENSGNGPGLRDSAGDTSISIRLPKWSVLCFRWAG